MALTIAQIQNAYVTFFNRPADVAGLQYWSSYAGNSADLLNTFAESAEYKDLYAGMNSTQLVNAVYQNLFGRPAEVAGLTYWVGQLDNGALKIGNIAEAINKGAQGTDADIIANKVTAATAFTNALDTNAEIVAYASANDTALNAVKTWLNTVTSDAASVTAATGAPLTAVLGTVQNNSNANVGQTFMLTANQDNVTGTSGNDTIDATNTTLQASDAINGGAGTDTFNYTDAGTTGGNVPAALVSNVEIINIRNVNGSAAVAATKEVANITFTDYTHGTANSTLVVGSQTFTLTASMTAAQIASMVAAAAQTDYDFTSLNGAQVVFTAKTAGTIADITVTATPGAGGTLATPTKSIVQGAAEVASTGVTDTVAASNFAGATDFNSVNSLNKVVFTGLSGTQNVGIVGNGSVLNGDVDYTLAGTAVATTINVKDGTKQGTVTNTGATVATATINSTGAANTLTNIDLGTGSNVTSLTINAATNLKTGIDSDFAATAALTVAGAASSVELTNGANATLKTIDASGLTAGGLTIALSTANTSFKGGQGNDVVTTAAIASTASVDAGAGTADVLVVGAAGDTDSAAEGALYKGFEVLRTADDQNMAHFSNSTITAIQMNAATSKTLSNVTAAQAGNITVRGDQTTAFTVTLADATGTADVVGLTLSNPTATATVPVDVDVAGLSIAGVETLNITSSGGGVDLANAATLNSVTFANNGADKLKNITVAGASSLDLSLTNTAVAVTVTSAQTGTGSLKVAGNVIKGSSITTTANKDDITVTAQADGAAGDYITYNAGAGDDAISATAAAINNSVNTKASVKIDGGAGTDTLTFSNSGLTLGDAQFQYVTNIEKFVNSAVGTVAITTGGFFDSNYKAAGAEFTLGEITTGAARSLDASSFTGNLKVTVSNNGAGNVSTVKTGAGNDTITLTQGATVNTKTHVVEAGLGNDTITAKNALVSITGGKGADVIDITDATNNSDTIVIAAGDSTAAARDKVTGFQAVATTGDKLDLAGTFSLQAAVAAADGTDSGVIKAHSITAGGIITFDDINAYDTALVINSSNVADALAYAAANFTTAGKTVGFAYDSDNNGTADATMVFQAGATAADATVIELVGLTGVTTLAATAGANTIVII